MPTNASNSGSGRKISSPRCSPSNRWLWQGDGLPLATQNTTVESIVLEYSRASKWNSRLKAAPNAMAARRVGTPADIAQQAVGSGKLNFTIDGKYLILLGTFEGAISSNF